MAGIPDEIYLFSPHVIEQIARLKKGIFETDYESLDLEETLISLSISAATSNTAELAMEKLSVFRGCDIHMTHIPTLGDEVGLKHLGINLTTDGKFYSRNLFVS